MNTVNPANPSPIDPPGSSKKVGQAGSSTGVDAQAAIQTTETPTLLSFAINQVTLPSPALVRVRQAVETNSEIEKKAQLLETKFREFVDAQFAKNPELQKMNTPSFREINKNDPSAVPNFKAALIEFYKQELKPLGFEVMLGMGTTGVVFKTQINDQDYSMKVFITKTDSKGYGVDLNLPSNQMLEVNKLNDINDELLNEVPSAKREGRFNFLQGRAKLDTNKNTLVYPFIEADPIIGGEIHFAPWTEWTVNEAYLDKGVKAQYISDFLNLNIRAQLKGINMTDFGQLHQTLYKDGKIYLLDPFGSNKYRSANPTDWEKDPATVLRMKHQKANPLVYPLSTLMCSVSTFEWLQKQGNPNPTDHAWRSAVLKHLNGDEKALDAIYDRNFQQLVDGILLAVKDAKDFKGHAEIFTKENLLEAIELVRAGSIFGDPEARDIAAQYSVKPLTERGREILDNLSKTLKDLL